MPQQSTQPPQPPRFGTITFEDVPIPSALSNALIELKFLYDLNQIAYNKPRFEEQAARAKHCCEEYFVALGTAMEGSANPPGPRRVP